MLSVLLQVLSAFLFCFSSVGVSKMFYVLVLTDSDDFILVQLFYYL